MLTTAILDNGL